MTVVHTRPTLIERWREYLPFSADDPIVSLNEGFTPLVYAPVDLRARGRGGLLQVRGGKSHRLLQGPWDDLRRLGRGARAAQGR